jgi:hypothetical protein
LAAFTETISHGDTETQRNLGQRDRDPRDLDLCVSVSPRLILSVPSRLSVSESVS